jgi:hypothetical protein
MTNPETVIMAMTIRGSVIMKDAWKRWLNVFEVATVIAGRLAAIFHLSTPQLCKNEVGVMG